MGTWSIVACCVAYLVLGAVIAGLYARIDGDMPPAWLAATILFAWPLMIIFVLFSLIMVIVAGDKATARYKKR